jgi:hypothetical protein
MVELIVLMIVGIIGLAAVLDYEYQKSQEEKLKKRY